MAMTSISIFAGRMIAISSLSVDEICEELNRLGVAVRRVAMWLLRRQLMKTLWRELVINLGSVEFCLVVEELQRQIGELEMERVRYLVRMWGGDHSMNHDSNWRFVLNQIIEREIRGALANIDDDEDSDEEESSEEEEHSEDFVGLHNGSPIEERAELIAESDIDGMPDYYNRDSFDEDSDGNSD